MSRNKSDLGYTESKSRPNVSVSSLAGESSADSKAIEEEYERQGKIYDQDFGRSFLPQGNTF